MDITWHGYSCFTVKTANASVVINPYNDQKGLKLPKLKADIAVVTGAVSGHNFLAGLWGEPYVIDCPGEYEVKEVAVTSMPIPEGKGFFFNLIGDGLKLCFIEKAGAELNDELIDKIGEVDILFVSVGGGDAMTAATAHKVIEKIEPRAVVPMYYAVEGATDTLAGLEEFMKEAGVAAQEPQEKISFTGKSNFKEDQTEYFIFKPQTA